MSVYQTNFTRHSPNLKQWKEDKVKTMNSAKDTQKQLERTLGKTMSLTSKRMIRLSVPIASGILPHHPVIKPNKPREVRRVVNGASKFHGISLN